MSKAERTRNFIIAKTAPIFNIKGYAGTSINDLTDITGLSKGSIYGNFENKDDVALAAFDYNLHRITSYYGLQISKREKSIDRLLVYPEIFENYYRIDFLESGCPILNTATEADDTHPLLNERVFKALKNWRQSIEHEVRRGIKSNEIKDSVNPMEISIVMVSIIEGSIMQSKVTKTATEVKSAMAFLKRIINDLST